MKTIKQHLFLTTVLAFAISSSSCQLLGGLMGGGAGGGLMDMLGGLIPGMSLTDVGENQNGLSLTGSQARVKNGYQIRATGKLPAASQQESTFYGTYHSH